MAKIIKMKILVRMNPYIINYNSTFIKIEMFLLATKKKHKIFTENEKKLFIALMCLIKLF